MRAFGISRRFILKQPDNLGRLLENGLALNADVVVCCFLWLFARSYRARGKNGAAMNGTNLLAVKDGFDRVIEPGRENRQQNKKHDLHERILYHHNE